MKSKKVTMIAAALVVAVVALAGIGYATTYTATTANENNSLSSTYLTVSQSGDGAYTDNFFTKLYYNTETTATKENNAWVDEVTYTPVLDYDANYAKTGTKTMALVSNVLTLTVKPMNNQQTSVGIVVTASAFVPNTDLIYTMIIADDYNSESGAFTNATPGTFNANNKTWTFTGTINAATDTTFKVALFISGETTTAIEDAAHTTCAGFAGSAATTKSVFTFVLTADSTVQTNSTPSP